MLINRLSWRDIPIYPEKMLRLDRNENQDSKLLQEIQSKFNTHSIHKYPDIYTGYKYTSLLYNIPIDQICLTQGSEQGIGLVLSYLNNKKIHTALPTFGMTEVHSKIHGCDKIDIEYVFKDDRFEIDYIGDHEILYIASPDNFTGYRITPDDVMSIARSCEYLILDCAYLKLVELTGYLELLSKCSNIFILHTASKYYAGPGIRLGFIFSNMFNVNQVMQYRPMYDVSSPAIDYVKFIYDNISMYDSSFDRISEAKKIFIELFAAGDVIDNACCFFITLKHVKSVIKILKDMHIIYRVFTIKDEKFIRVTTPCLSMLV